jgi:hypothetical protein
VTLVLGASWCLAIAGIVLGLATLATFGKPLPALRLMLELLTAAGLLRLSVDSSWTAIAATAALIIMRKTITRSLIADLTTPRGPRASRTT